MDDIATFHRWLDRCDLTIDTFSAKLREEALLWLVRSWAGPDMESRIIDELLMTGEYERLVARARDKERVLESRGLQNPRVEDVGLAQEELLCWYFEQRLGGAVPRDVRVYARENGFEDDLSLRRAILREYCYCVSSVRNAARTA